MFQFINENLIKKYDLTSNDFDQYLINFNELIEKIDLKSLDLNKKTIYVEFSDEYKVITDGKYTLNNIKDYIMSRCGNNDKKGDLENTLHGIKSIHQLQDRLSQILEEVMSTYGNNERPNYDELKNDIQTKMDNFKFTYTINGEFNHITKKITLYVKTMEKGNLHDGILIRKTIERVFAHELFHLFHYFNKQTDELFDRFDYTSKVIKESLASYFENLYYLTYCHETFGYENPVISSWVYPVTIFPYSGARYIDNDDCFKKILSRSYENMDNTLMELVPNDEFRRIKSKATYKIIGKNKTNIPMFYINKHVFIARNKDVFEKESRNGYLFVPIGECDLLKKARARDIILHIFDDKLFALSVSNGNSYCHLTLFDEFIHSNKECGCYLDATYYIFEEPIDLSKLSPLPNYQKEVKKDIYISELNDYSIFKLILDIIKNKVSLDLRYVGQYKLKD